MFYNLLSVSSRSIVTMDSSEIDDSGLLNTTFMDISLPVPEDNIELQNIIDEAASQSDDVFSADDQDNDPDCNPDELEKGSDSDNEIEEDTGNSLLRTPTLITKTSPRWKRAVSKKNRNNGYQKVSGKAVDKRKVAPFECNCKNKCNENFSHEEREEINKKYYDLPDFSSKKHFINNNVIDKKCYRSITAREGRRQFTFVYNFNEIPVCKPFFLKTLNISDTVIMNLKKKTRKDDNIGVDGRGKHVNHIKTSGETLMNIKNHILRFPRVESHYCRKSSTVQYLPADLNLQKMFEFFEKENPETTVKISTYRRVFKTFKLSFHKPKKDLCNFCTKYKNSTENEKTLLNDQMNEHMQNKEDSRAEKQRDKEAAEADLTLKVYTYDLQAVLSSPRAEESSFYYSRKFATYNLTLYDLATGAGFCYLWHETNGKRGADEVASILYKHLQNLPGNVDKVILYSDCCGGQNRNR